MRNIKINGKQKRDLAMIGLSIVLLIAGFITEYAWLFIASYIVAGWRTILEAVSGIIHGQLLDENFLMTIASIAALYCGKYEEGVAVMLLYQIGEFFEHYAVNSSRNSIADLMDIVPETARRLSGDKEEIVDPAELAIGDIILVRPGEKIPVDGVVTDGFSSLNTAALTGESAPRDVSPGSDIISGTVNLSGVLRIRTTKLFEDSTVSKVLELVESAASRKASVEKFITKFARYYTPVVVLLAVVLAIIPPLTFSGEGFHHWIYIAAEFLVISCPCALVISVPLSLFAGVGSASRQGILVKGSNFLEALADVSVVAFDKTGTLTTGRFAVSEIKPAKGFSEDQVLKTAAYGESMSGHPIALSIVERFTAGAEIDKSVIAGYTEVSGKGVSAEVDGVRVCCGNGRFMHDLNLTPMEPDSPGSVVHVAAGGRYMGYVLVTDTVRENSVSTIHELSSLGVDRTYMLTGDRRDIAEKTAKELGLTGVLAELLPSDKVSALEKLLSEKGKGHLAYVGDGINDAPVLSRADIGIAMGAYGSDAAVESADIVIMTDDISKVSTVTRIARKTLKICKENIVFALAIKLVILALAPFGLVSMWLAVFADVGVAFIAILNAMRALKL